MSQSDDDDYGECDCGDDDCPSCGGDCWYCHGEGSYISGEDHDDDPLWIPPGTVVKCPNCGGTGKAKDCTFW